MAMPSRSAQRTRCRTGTRAGDPRRHRRCRQSDRRRGHRRPRGRARRRSQDRPALMVAGRSLWQPREIGRWPATDGPRSARTEVREALAHLAMRPRRFATRSSTYQEGTSKSCCAGRSASWHPADEPPSRHRRHRDAPSRPMAPFAAEPRGTRSGSATQAPGGFRRTGAMKEHLAIVLEAARHQGSPSTTSCSPVHRGSARRRWPASLPQRWEPGFESPPVRRWPEVVIWPRCSPGCRQATCCSSTRSIG